MTTAMYPGRFDPVTNGHLDIVRRAATIYERVVVAVAQSRTTLFTMEERARLFREAVAAMPNVSVIPYEGPTVLAARREGAQVLVKGLRAITDFNDEFDQALMNRKLAPEIESAFLMTSLEYLFISATRIRELASLGLDVSDLVPPSVARALSEKFPQRPTGQ
ncbi:MAG: pantetheine-phosphate adenylyltransferase [Dehalococcoidia bacterium]|nr:pantetheine-phosphate adenylyltransferase [Dehalococcoidia bacterium]